MRKTIIGLALASTITLSGCSLDWASMSPDLPNVDKGKPQVEETPDATVEDPPLTKEPLPKPRPPSDLETGSLTHKLPAGPIEVILDYWTDQQAKKWRGQSASINLALRVATGSKYDILIKITRAKVVADKTTVLLEDIGEFAVQAPYSYGSQVQTPVSTAKRMTLDVQFDLLIETEEDSGVFFRQSVFDTITLTFEETK